jgi:hypothetical protein
MSLESTLSPATIGITGGLTRKVADDGRHSDVDHVVAESPPVGPSPWDHPTTEPCLNRACEGVAAEDPQA